MSPLVLGSTLLGRSGFGARLGVFRRSTGFPIADGRFKRMVRSRKPMLRSLLLGFSVFCVTLGARLGVVDQFGSDLPRMDQWDAEYGMVLAPFLQGSFSFGDLFIPHNEHVIVCTKATALFLFSVNGQWDNRAECVVNATIVALFAVGLVFAGRRVLGGAAGVVWSVVVLLLCALPVSITNVLSGFHSQQFFLIVFSVVGLVLVLVHREWSKFWVLGVLCGVLALFSMASGLLMAVAAILALVPGHGLAARLRERGPTIVACVVLVVVGLLFRGDAAWHASLRAHSLWDFLGTIWRALTWPVGFFPLFPLFAWLPWLLLGWRLARSGEASCARDRAVFAVGLWVLLQVVATAYARGAGAPEPSSRYMDTLAVGIGANVLALLMTVNRANHGNKTSANIWRALAVVGVSVFAVGFSLHIGRVVFGSLSEYGALAREWESNVGAYLADGDPGHLDGGEIPYISSERLIEYLDQPESRAILPSSVQGESRSGPLSIFAARSAAAGWVVFYVGLVGCLFTLGNELRRLRIGANGRLGGTLSGP